MMVSCRTIRLSFVEHSLMLFLYFLMWFLDIFLQTGEIGKGTANMATQVTAVNPGKGIGITRTTLTDTGTIMAIVGLTMITAAQGATATAVHLANVPMTNTVMTEIIGATETTMTGKHCCSVDRLERVSKCSAKIYLFCFQTSRPQEEALG